MGNSSVEVDTIPLSPVASPIKTLQVYCRLAFGRKHLFAPSDSDPAEYFITNPVPHKHASQWKPVFYRGDNPKYDERSKKIARARRTAIWSSFQIQLGDGVHEVMENKRRVSERKSYERKQKFRRWFWMKPTPPKKPLEEVEEVKGFVMTFEMKRTKFLNRSLRWKLGEQEFKWTGTRRFLPSWSSRWKGVSHDLKLVDSNNNVIATLEKGRWASYKSSIKSDGPPNKSKTLLGTLSIFPSTSGPIRSTDLYPPALQPASGETGNSGEKVKSKNKFDKDLNLSGSHSGDLMEEALVLTCWIALEGEHRLRYKILDLIEEIGESFGG